MKTTLTVVLLLVASNTFMTIAWYGHLKYRHVALITTVVVSWLIALPEYSFQVPANRIGYGQFTATQLKVIQEVVSLSVFAVFAFLYLGDARPALRGGVPAHHRGRSAVRGDGPKEKGEGEKKPAEVQQK